MACEHILLCGSCNWHESGSCRLFGLVDVGGACTVRHCPSVNRATVVPVPAFCFPVESSDVKSPMRFIGQSLFLLSHLTSSRIDYDLKRRDEQGAETQKSPKCDTLGLFCTKIWYRGGERPARLICSVTPQKYLLRLFSYSNLSCSIV